MVTDGALKLKYAIVIFVYSGVQIDETELNSLAQLLSAHARSLIVIFFIYDVKLPINKIMAQRTQSTVVYNIHISQGGVAAHLRCGEILKDKLTLNANVP